MTKTSVDEDRKELGVEQRRTKQRPWDGSKKVNYDIEFCNIEAKAYVAPVLEELR